MLNHKFILERFQRHIKNNYDLSDSRILRKYEHTHSVLEISTSIAVSANFSSEDIFIAQIIAILHDCARFPQIEKFGTFKDSEQYHHSIEGAKLLEGGLLEKMLPETREYDSIIITAVRYHGLLNIPSNLDEKTKMHCELIRDADRTDLFNLFLNKFDDLFWNDIGEPVLSSKVKELYANREPIPFSEINNQIDFLALRFGLICQYKFKSALAFIKRNDYVNRITDLFLEKRPFYNIEEVEWIRKTALEFLNSEEALF